MRSPARFPRLLAMASVAFGVIALLALGTPEKGLADPLVVLPMEVLEPENCNYHCRSCGENKHDIVTHHSTNNHKSSHLENCNTGSCAGHACGSSLLAARVVELWNEAQGLDAKGLRLLLAENSDVAFYNSERGALQFQCAEGRVVASLPIDQARMTLTE